jgi:hypothetical protein
MEAAGKYSLIEHEGKTSFETVVWLKMLGVVNADGDAVAANIVISRGDRSSDISLMIWDMFRAIERYLREHPEFVTMEEWEPRRQGILAKELPRKRELGLVS